MRQSGFGVGNSGGQPQFTDLNQGVRTMQIITGALLAGVIMFGVVSTMAVLNRAAPNPAQPPQAPIITYLAVGMTLMELGLRAVIPDLVARQNIARMQDSLDDSDQSRLRLASVYQTRMIIGMALCEGAAFFALIAWMLEGNVLAIGTAGFLVLVMLTAFPTRDRVESWIRDQIELRNLV